MPPEEIVRVVAPSSVPAVSATAAALTDPTISPPSTPTPIVEIRIVEVPVIETVWIRCAIATVNASFSAEIASEAGIVICP